MEASGALERKELQKMFRRDRYGVAHFRHESVLLAAAAAAAILRHVRRLSIINLMVDVICTVHSVQVVDLPIQVDLVVDQWMMPLVDRHCSDSHPRLQRVLVAAGVALRKERRAVLLVHLLQHLSE